MARNTSAIDNRIFEPRCQAKVGIPLSKLFSAVKHRASTLCVPRLTHCFASIGAVLLNGWNLETIELGHVVAGQLDAIGFGHLSEIARQHLL